MVAIFYGRKHRLVDEQGQQVDVVGFRVVRGGAALRVPVLEQVAYLSLNIISIPLKIQRAYTKEGVAVTVEAVANVKIAGDDVSLRGAAERFLGMPPDQIKGVIFQTLEGHLRAILGTLTVEEINADRAAVRAEDDRRGRRRSEEDGRQHRHPDDPADQRRAGVPRRARARSARPRSSATRSSARRRRSATR